MLVATAILFIVWGGYKILDFRTPNETDFSNWCLLGAGFFFSVWCFIWLPFRRHETTLKNHAEEIKRLSKVVDTRKVKDSLGEFIRVLESRTSAIGATTIQAYSMTFENIGGHIIDNTSLDLIIHIYNFIKENVGTVEAELFNSVTELSATDNLENKIALTGRNAEGMRTYMIARLQLHVKQLKDIIDNLN